MKKILIVEDEAIVARDLETIVGKLGHHVIGIESSGEAALEKAGREKPDLALMDIMLCGRMDGIEAARKMRCMYHIPVVFLTAYADDAIIEQAKTTEPSGYIIKPFRERELEIVLEMVLYRAAMEKRIQEREKLLSTILSSIADGVIAVDSSGYITFLNPVAEKLTGLTSEEATGKQTGDLLSISLCDSPVPETLPLSAVIKEGRVVSLEMAEMKVAGADTQVLVALNAAPILDDRGQIRGAVLVFRDIAEKKRMADELMKAQKLEAIGVLAGGIAHELNNILTAILGNISLSKLSINASHEIYENLMDAEEASHRAQALAQQLLVFSRGGWSLIKTVEIGSILKSCALIIAKTPGISCDLAIAEDLPMVDIDKEQISQVITSVMVNSVQAMPGGGIIHIGAERVDRKETGEDLHFPAEGAYIRISVQDHGEGIPRENLSRIFDPFFTTKELGKGLGLAVSYSILQKHKGHIDVQSKVGQGTTVCVFLPVSKEPGKIKPERE